MKNLSKCLHRLEAVAGRERHSPFGDLLRRQLPQTPGAEDRGRLAKQPPQLRNRHRLHIVLSEIRVDKFGERERTRDPALAARRSSARSSAAIAVCSDGNPPR
jgi:hypothetical protein